MPNNISRQRLKKKVLDRWENEGGKLSADETGIIRSGSYDKRAGKDNTGQTSESRKAERPKRKNNKGGTT